MRITTVFAAFLACAVLSCSEIPTQSVDMEATGDQYSKVDRVTYRFPYSNEGSELYAECVGEILDLHGTVDIIMREQYTPSGNVIMSWKIDYWDTDELSWAQGRDSGTIWYLLKGQNQGTGWVMKPNGTREITHAEWSDWYVNDAGDKVHINGLWRVKIDKDGNVEREQWGYKANCS